MVRARYGWPRLILSDDSERGGKLATFVLYMAEDTNLVGASISNYVWVQSSEFIIARVQANRLG